LDKLNLIIGYYSGVSRVLFDNLDKIYMYFLGFRRIASINPGSETTQDGVNFGKAVIQ
jgi:hypothetical protein